MPLILLAPDPDRGALSRWWETRSSGFRWLVWIGVSLASVAAILIGATALTTWLFESDGAAAGAGVESTDVRSAAVGDAGGSSGLESLAFASLADSVEARIRRYRTVDRGTGGGDCSGLTRSYEQVDDAFLSLAMKVGQGGEADLRNRQRRFRELAAAVEEVEASFDESGCPRPG